MGRRNSDAVQQLEPGRTATEQQTWFRTLRSDVARSRREMERPAKPAHGASSRGHLPVGLSSAEAIYRAVLGFKP